MPSLFRNSPGLFLAKRAPRADQKGGEEEVGGERDEKGFSMDDARGSAAAADIGFFCLFSTTRIGRVPFVRFWIEDWTLVDGGGRYPITCISDRTKQLYIRMVNI